MNVSCPIDATPLAVTNSDGVNVLGCERCKGGWLSGTGAFGMFSRRSGGEAQFAKFREGVQLKGRASPLKCLDCDMALRTVSQGTVEIESCPECGGIWFDGGELRRFSQGGRGKAATVAAVAVGGAALGVAGLAGAAALKPEQPAAQGSTLAGAVGEVAVDGAFEVVFEVAGSVISGVFTAIFD